jgi:hypothetical protein
MGLRCKRCVRSHVKSLWLRNGRSPREPWPLNERRIEPGRSPRQAISNRRRQAHVACAT